VRWLSISQRWRPAGQEEEKKKKKTVNSTRLGDSIDLVFPSASNAHDHATAKDTLLDRLDLVRVLQRLQRPLDLFPTRLADDSQQQLEKMIKGPAAMETRMVPCDGTSGSAFNREQAKRKNDSILHEVVGRDPRSLGPEDFIRAATAFSELRLSPDDLAKTRIRVIGFGGSDASKDTWTTVICPPMVHSFLMAHPLYDMPIIMEPHISKVPQLTLKDIPVVCLPDLTGANWLKVWDKSAR
jgi:hypothetical protein